MKKSTIITKALPAAVILATAGGFSAHSNAAAYALSYDNVYNLNILSSPFVPLERFESFTANSSTGATLNGAIDPANPGGFIFAGGPVDAPVAYGLGSVFPGGAPANNAMAAQGPGGAGTSYAYGDAQVSQTSLTQASLFDDVVLGGGPTQAWNIAEAYIDGDGFADASGANGSVTGFTTVITIDDPTAFTFSFNADPYMEVFLSADAAGTVNANLDVTFSITGQGGTVFTWSPSGNFDAEGGTVTASPFDLNGSIDVGVSGDSAVFNPCGNGAPTGVMDRGCSGSNLFSAVTDLLAAGSYTISLNMSEDVDMFTAIRPQVPAPGVLALFGLALAGLGVSRRRRSA